MIEEIHSPSSHLAYKAMLELRPNIGPEPAFADQVNKRMRISAFHFSRPA